MKISLFAFASAAAILAAGAAQAADKITLQLKWVPQAQFAGYYVAKDKGFYKDEGLDVTIKPGGPDVAPEQVIAGGGGADVVVDWMPAALAAREKGAAMVNIAQPFKRSDELTCSILGVPRSRAAIELAHHLAGPVAVGADHHPVGATNPRSPSPRGEIPGSMRHRNAHSDKPDAGSLRPRARCRPAPSIWSPRPCSHRFGSRPTPGRFPLPRQRHS